MLILLIVLAALGLVAMVVGNVWTSAISGQLSLDSQCVCVVCLT